LPQSKRGVLSFTRDAMLCFVGEKDKKKLRNGTSSGSISRGTTLFSALQLGQGERKAHTFHGIQCATTALRMLLPSVKCQGF